MKDNHRFFLKIFFDSSDFTREEKVDILNEYIKTLTTNLKSKNVIVDDCEISSIKKEHGEIRVKIKIDVNE